MHIGTSDDVSLAGDAVEALRQVFIDAPPQLDTLVTELTMRTAALC